MRARHHLFADLMGRHAIYLANERTVLRQRQRAPRLVVAHTELALRRHANCEGEQSAAARKMRARVTAPVDETDEQMTVGENRIERGEQPPGRVTLQRRGAFELVVDVADGALECREVGRMRKIRRHVVERALDFAQVGAQLGRGEGRRRGARGGWAQRGHAEEQQDRHARGAA